MINKERNIIRSRWRAMKQRCYNPSNDNYKYYGGKGIKVCEEWHNFEKYLQWCYSHGYILGICDSIERLDNNSDYSPQNCIIISRKEQQKHKSDNHYITYNGKTQILSDWAKEYNLPSYLLRQRLNRDKLPMSVALNKNYDGRKQNWRVKKC